MKSLLITFDYPPDTGGMAQYYAAMVTRAKGDVDVLHLQHKTARLSWLFYLPLLLRRLRTFNELRVGNVLPLGYCALIVKFLCGTPYTVYTHGKDVFHGLSAWKRFMVRVILSRARFMWANSEYVRGELINRYGIPREKITVEYPRVDVAALEKTAALAQPILKNAPFILLSVGRLVERKGFDMVIRALAYLKEANPSLALLYWIVGAGEDEPRLRAIAKICNIEQMIRFLGAVPRQTLLGYYKACDALIMPSRDIEGDVEGFGIVFLETAVFRKPVIGGKSGGVPEAVADGVTGLLVDPLDVKDVARAIERLFLNAEAGRRMGEAGYERIRKQFDYAN